jgi:hypothetical protein
MLIWSLSFMGLGIAFVGTLFIIVGTPRDTSANMRVTTFSPDSPEGINEEKAFKFRAKSTGWGIIFLAVGFFIQLISLFLQMPE